MKKLNLLCISLLLISFLFTSCSENIKHVDPPVPKDKLISTKTANAYIAQYDSIKYKAISEATGKPDALEFYITIEELEGYIAFVKSEAKKQNVSVGGLAISLGAYPKGTVKGELYDNLTTVILRPYGSLNGVSYLVPPKETEIIETINPLNDLESSPPL